MTAIGSGQGERSDKVRAREARRERLAAELRANLRKRKAHRSVSGSEALPPDASAGRDDEGVT